MFCVHLILLLLFTVPLSDKQLVAFVNTGAEIETYDEIDPFIDALYYQDKNFRFVGYDSLLKFAAQSKSCRMQVIEALTRVLQDKKLLNYQKEIRYKTWYDALGLLERLNSVEKVSFLIEYLDYTVDNKGISLNYYPVIKVVAKLSQNSIKPLSKALFEHKKAIIRINSARSLGLIGSDEAKTVLLEALELEKDPQVKFYIQEQINKWLVVKGLMIDNQVY